MKKKKIFWLTGSSFFDVDENIVPALAKDYDIYWFHLRQKESFYTKEYIDNHLKNHGIDGETVNWPKLRSLKSLWYYTKLALKIKKGKYDIIYIDFLGLPYMFLVFHILGLDKKKIIYACHDVIEHVNIENRGFINRYKDFVFSKFKNFHIFSKSQLSVFKNQFPDKFCFYAPLALKGFGEPSKAERKDTKKINFMFFGRIRNRKGLEYLILAANKLNKVYSDQFNINIYGDCKDWSEYDKLIENSDNFNINVRRIENEEIPGIFAENDFLVLPYKDVTQSGPLFISYFYEVPVIASDHPGFSEYINNGENGFLFKNEDADDLAKIMSEIISGKFDYNKIKSNLREYISDNLTLDTIVANYKEGFHQLNETYK